MSYQILSGLLYFQRDVFPHHVITTLLAMQRLSFKPTRGPRHDWASARDLVIHLFSVKYAAKVFFLCCLQHTQKKKKKVNKVKWMQEVAGQREFIWHCSFNRSRCPSNSLPSSAAYSGCADWMQQLQQSEMEVSSRYLTQQHALSVIDRERGACASL